MHRLQPLFLHYSTKRAIAQKQAIHITNRFDDSGAMAHHRKSRAPAASEQLEVLLGHPWPFPGRPPKHDLSAWSVTDDWPEDIPVTDDEVDVFGRWFGDLFDELFGASHS